MTQSGNECGNLQQRGEMKILYLWEARSETRRANEVNETFEEEGHKLTSF